MNFKYDKYVQVYQLKDGQNYIRNEKLTKIYVSIKLNLFQRDGESI